MTLINNIVTQVRKLKTSQQLSLKTSLSNLTIHCSAEIKLQLITHEQLIKGVTQATTITYNPHVDIESQIVGDNGEWVAVVGI